MKALASLDKVIAPKLVAVAKAELEKRGEDEFYFDNKPIIEASKARRLWR